MGLLGGIIGSIGSAIAAKKARAAQEEYFSKQNYDNEENFKRQYNQDIMSRSDTQSVLRKANNMLKEQNQRQQNIGAITGATPEAIAAMKKNNAEAIGNLSSNIQGQSQSIKDNALNQYNQRKYALAAGESNADQNYYTNRAGAWTQLGNAISGPEDALVSGGISTLYDKIKK